MRLRAASSSSLFGSLVLAAVYVAVGSLFRTPALRPAFELCWPPVGVALAGLLLYGVRLWPGVLAGALLEPWLAGLPPAASLGASAGTVVETVGAAWLLRRVGFRTSLERVRDVLHLLFVAVLGGALVGASIETGWALLMGAPVGGDLLRSGLREYRRHALAALLITPLPLTWASAAGLDWLRRRKGEVALFLAGLMTVTYFATGGLPPRLESAFPTRYLTFPFMFWGALRLGPSAVAVANLIVVGIAVEGRWLAEGTLPGEPVGDRLLLLWAYSFFGSFTGLVLAANAREREIARQREQIIQEANVGLTRSLDIDTVLETLLAALARLVPFDSANVMLREDGRLRMRAGIGYERFSGHSPLGSFPVAEPAWWDRLQQGSLVVPDSAHEPGWVVVPGGEHVRSWLAVPLRAGGETIGLYSLDKAEAGFFTAEHIRLAEALAAQGAIAIANARLYEQSRRDREALRASEKMEAVGRLAGGVAHDFNNMMMAITAQCELLARKRRPGDPLPAAIEEIQQVARSASSLSRQLLAFSRKQTLQPRVLHLNLLCERSLRMLRRLIGDHIEIRFRPDPGLRHVRADPSGLEQVLMNLCVNARDAMPQGGTLTIATGNDDLEGPLAAGEDALPPGRYVHLQVADTGVGIDPGLRSRIFEPFFTTKEVGKGTGLGLAVVYGVVRQSGGVISVDSAPGRGSVFTVFLPETEEPLGETAEPAVPAPASGSETLLLVDDNEAVRKVIAQYLRAEGYTVVAADNGASALHDVRRESLAVDLLITDVTMPGLTGAELAHELGAQFPDLRVLYVSGHPPESLASGTLPPRTRFLQKPFPLPELVREIRSLLDE